VYTLLPLTSSSLPLQGRRILIVDDQPSIRGVLQVALEEAGADVWTAGDGASALVILESALPDLILLDLAMPVMDGWEVLRRLKANHRTAQLPVILETSAQDYASYATARKEGIAAFLSKPFRLHEVIETCRRVLDGARPMQGKPPREDAGAGPDVQIRDLSGNLMGVGRLLDLAPRGAQVEMDEPLAPGAPYTVTLRETAGARVVTGEVRWVRKVGEHFHHGFSLRE
jgi:CheY-like chemotaxis protein